MKPLQVNLDIIELLAQLPHVKVLFQQIVLNTLSDRSSKSLRNLRELQRQETWTPIHQPERFESEILKILENLKGIENSVGRYCSNVGRPHHQLLHKWPKNHRDFQNFQFLPLLNRQMFAKPK